MVLRTKVKVTRIFGTKKLDNLAILGARTLKLRKDVGPHQWMTLRPKVLVKVTVTFNTKKLIVLQCLRLEPLNLGGMLVLTNR